MQIKKILSWAALILMLSCEKDIRVKAPAEPTKLVINSITSTNTRFTATVGRTAGILDVTTPESYLVSNAVIVLYENNVLKDTLAYNANKRIYLAKYNSIPKAGLRYQLKASAPEFTSVEGETVVPAGVTIESISRRMKVRADKDSNIYDEVKIRFTDDGAASNYYRVRFRRPFENGNGIYYEPMFCIRSLDTDIDRRTDVDPILFDDCIDRELTIADMHFNGSVKELIVFIRHHELHTVLSPGDNRKYHAVIELNNITADHYKYRKSYTAYRDSEDNPFAEPVLVYTNIRHGYGLFSAYNLAVDTIR